MVAAGLFPLWNIGVPHMNRCKKHPFDYRNFLAFLACMALCFVLSSCGGGSGTAAPDAASLQPGVYLVAGNAGGTGNADGTGRNARFSNPLGIARDPSGIIYVSDANNSSIRKISKAGQVSTLALSSQFPGDTSLRGGTQMAVDRDGNLVVAGWGCGSYLIKIAPDGTKTYLDSSSKIFSYPPGWINRYSCFAMYQVGVALGQAGEYYVSDTLSNAIRKVNPDGGVSTIAGTDFVAGSTDGAGASALFNLPAGLALDAAGNLFVADLGNNTIRKISPAGVVTTVAGKAGIKGSTDGSVSAALFNAPQSIVVDAQGNLFVSDTGNHTVRKISQAGVVSTVAGSAGASGVDDGNGTSARFKQPAGLAIDDTGMLYVSDSGNNTIRTISSTGTVTTVAGSAPAIGQRDGTGATALFNNPQGVVADSDGNMFVADTYNHTIRKVTPAGVVTTFAGRQDAPGQQDGTGTAASFFYPTDITIDSSGNLFVTDYNYQIDIMYCAQCQRAIGATVRKITPTGEVSTLAGSSTQLGYVDGKGNSVRFGKLKSITITTAGDLLVLDAGDVIVSINSDVTKTKIRRISPDGTVTTVAINNATTFVDPLSGASGMALDNQNNLYVAIDCDENLRLRKIAPDGTLNTVLVAGSESIFPLGMNSYSRVDTAVAECRAGIAADAKGNLYVPSAIHGQIREITPAGGLSAVAGLGDQRSDAYILGLLDHPTALKAIGQGVFAALVPGGVLKMVLPR